jgi:hypothetical protein
LTRPSTPLRLKDRSDIGLDGGKALQKHSFSVRPITRHLFRLIEYVDGRVKPGHDAFLNRRSLRSDY